MLAEMVITHLEQGNLSNNYMISVEVRKSRRNLSENEIAVGHQTKVY